jgi:hypothetical protein
MKMSEGQSMTEQKAQLYVSWRTTVPHNNIYESVFKSDQ